MNNHIKFMVGGALGVTLAGIIGVVTGNIWASFFIAILVAAIGLFFLDRFYISKLEPAITKSIIRVLLILLITSQAYLGVVGAMKSTQQSETLTTIRTILDAGIIQIGVEKTMVNALKIHHTQQSDEVALVESFKEAAVDKISRDNRYIDDEFWTEGYHSEIDIVSPAEIRITTVAKIGKGEDPQFQNLNGKSGMYQSTATLTEGGVYYVREN